MSELIAKLESYKIFNNLYPGVLFLAACHVMGIVNVNSSNLAVGAFVAYFCGMTIGRIGSLLLEPAFRRLGFVVFAPYSEYVAAEKMDSKIKLLSEESNVLRTLVSLFICVASAWAFKAAVEKAHLPNWTLGAIGLVLLTVLYSFAYKKQVAFVKERIAFLQTQ